MTLADYTFYTDTFLGKNITAELFPKYSAKADHELKRMTLNMTTYLDTYEQEYNLAVCEIADYFYECDLNNAKEVTSESVGGYSVSYVTNPYKSYDLALPYLGHTGLLNAAVYTL